MSEFINIRRVVQKAEGKIAILIGNGLSIKVYNKFNYKSLFEEAERLDPTFCTMAEIFNELKTTNFEKVLRNLKITIRIGKKLGLNNLNRVTDSQNKIKTTFKRVLTHIHPEFDEISKKVHTIHDELKSFSRVFTTNYDLIIYWAIFKDRTNFTDRFVKDKLTGEWGFRFDDYEGKAITHIYFLHGAFHIVQDEFGISVKLQNTPRGQLLTQIKTGISNNTVWPLYVAEGDFDDKLKKVKSNPYLAMAYEKLENLTKLNSKEAIDLVIYGHSLSETFDKHIINAIKNSKVKNIYYGIFDYNRKLSTIGRIKELFEEKPSNPLLGWVPFLKRRDVYFFDSSELFSF